MSLYQKYRPKDFDNLIGQQFIRRALTSALQKQKTVSVYLFCGSRGTGKTSVARILAKAFNCKNLREDGNPCAVCDNCLAFTNGTMLDTIEIDGASNNGVDNVRELIEKSKFQPTYGKYKVYIIDEVHMLSTGAFNALLKTLEDTPDHVKFILATTEFHKIPETVVSRAQRYDFRKISDVDIVGRLTYIAEQEQIETDTKGLQLIAQLARGGLRDAISLFEQYSIGGVLSYDFIRENLAIVGTERLEALTESILQSDAQMLIDALQQLKMDSVDSDRFFEQYLYFLKDLAFDSLTSPKYSKIMRLFEACTIAYTKIKSFPNSFLLLEMTLLGQLQPINQVVTGDISASKATKITPPKLDLLDPVIVSSPPVKKTVPKDIEKPVSSEETPPPITSWTPKFSFLELVNFIKNSDRPKKGVLVNELKVGTFDFNETTSNFTLFVTTEFARKQLDTPEYRDFLGTSLQALFGIQPQIHFSLGNGGKRIDQPKESLNLKQVSDIF